MTLTSLGGCRIVRRWGLGPYGEVRKRPMCPAGQFQRVASSLVSSFAGCGGLQFVSIGQTDWASKPRSSLATLIHSAPFIVDNRHWSCGEPSQNVLSILADGDCQSDSRVPEEKLRFAKCWYSTVYRSNPLTRRIGCRAITK